MRSDKEVQVTILNDRPQGGAADLSDNSTIELMQNRRMVADDEKGLGDEEPLNEMDKDGNGIRVSARYFMQIFNFKKGKSL